MLSLYRRIAAAVLFAIAGLAFATPAAAEVRVGFHSFNGSVLWGRYPHTFVTFDGTLDNGTKIRENYGFSARSSTEAIRGGPSSHMIIVEKEATIPKTNLHFTVTVPDATYRRMKAEVIAWRDAPGKLYILDKRNCIHFVAKLAEIAGIDAPVPSDYVRTPKAWLNYVTRRNPKLGAKEID